MSKEAKTLFDELIEKTNITKDGKIEISLLDKDNTKYCQEKIELLEQFAGILKDKDICKVDIVLLNERIPFEVFLKIKKFYEKTKDCVETNLIVEHKSLNKSITEKKLWDIDTIIKANDYIETVCNTIKQKNMSPAEALAYIHFCTSSIAKYQISKQQSWISDDQIFCGAFKNTPEFVCAGCVSLFYEIVKTLNMPQLQCDMIALTTNDLDNGKIEDHCRLKIKLVDKKYDIDDEFYDDPTWDMVDFDKISKYSHLFMPKDCHEENKSKFDFFDFDEKITNEQSELRYKRFYPETEWTNQTTVPLKQLIIEKIVFCVLCKTTNQSFEKTYAQMELMAKASFDEQRLKRYKSTLKSNALQMDKKIAKKIFCENKIIFCNQKNFDL